MIWENKIPSQQKPTPLDRLDNRPFMTEVGGLFSRVAPGKNRHRLSPNCCPIGDALRVNAC